MTTKRVAVQSMVSVTVDETKFTPEFMAEFRDSMYSFLSIDDHIEHLAQLYARGLCDEFTKFIEGYGPPSDMGVECKVTDVFEEVVRE